MLRAITRYRTDEHGDWVAVLDCGHPQHVRHQPPFVNRPWTATEQGRQDMLGQQLNCVRCENFELPDHFAAYKRTPVFTEQSVPAGLLDNHTTKTGVWAKIVVLEGRLHYCVDPLQVSLDLSPDQPGIVIPQVPHRVAPDEAVRFFVEFYRAPDGSE